MRNQKKAGFRKLSGMNKVSLNADKHEGRFMNRAMKSMPWLICASAAWLTLVPCEIAFADDTPSTDNVLRDKDEGEPVEGGRLVIDQSVADKAVSGSKWYLTSNWSQTGNATDGRTRIQSGVTIKSSNVFFVSGSLAPNGTATNSSVTATNAFVYGDIIGGDGHKGASDNIVEITDKTIVSRSVIGGRVQDNIGENDAAINNRVDMSGSATYEVRGGVTVYGNAVNNQVSLEKKSNATVIYGGFVKYNGDAIKNEVYLKNSEVQVIYGGYSETKGNALNNIIQLENSNVSAYCIGGYVSNGKAESNKVHLNNSTASSVFGGGYYYMQEVDALRNIVSLEDKSKVESVYGGFTTKGKADGNEVTGSDSLISFAVYGGWGTTGASDNKVTLDKVTVSGNVGGGKTDSGAASGNEVSLSNGTTFKGDLYAGYTDDGDAIGNKLELTDISQEVYDIYSSFTKTGQAGGEVTLTNSQVDNVYGGKTEKGAANDSKVIGKGDTTIEGSVYGGQGTTGASSNTVDLENVKVSGKVRGGDTKSGEASNNKVSLSNGTTFTDNLYAGYTENGNATGNEVSLSDVSAPKDVYASYTTEGQAGGIDDETRSKVTITESSVTGSVYGGYTKSGAANYSSVTIIDSTLENTDKGATASSVYAGYTVSAKPATIR